jgi:hypothetical protein
MIAGPGNVDENKRERWPIAYGTSVHAKWHATMLERRNTSTNANQVSADSEPMEVHADQERIKEGRLSPHVIVGSTSKDVPLLRRYINGSSVATTVHPEDNILRMLRLDGGYSAAKDLCENAR